MNTLGNQENAVRKREVTSRSPNRSTMARSMTTTALSTLAGDLTGAATSTWWLRPRSRPRCRSRRRRTPVDGRHGHKVRRRWRWGPRSFGSRTTAGSDSGLVRPRRHRWRESEPGNQSVGAATSPEAAVLAAMTAVAKIARRELRDRFRSASDVPARAKVCAAHAVSHSGKV